MKSNFVYYNDSIVLHPLGILVLIFYHLFSEKNPVYRDRTHVPTCQKVTWLPLSYPGDCQNGCVPSVPREVGADSFYLDSEAVQSLLNIHTLRGNYTTSQGLSARPGGE